MTKDALHARLLDICDTSDRYRGIQIVYLWARNLYPHGPTLTAYKQLRDEARAKKDATILRLVEELGEDEG